MRASEGPGIKPGPSAVDDTSINGQPSTDVGPSPPSSASEVQASHGVDRRALVLLHALLLAGLGVTALTVTGAVGSLAAPLALPWWLVVVLFVGAEASAFHVEIRRETHTLSLSGIVLVLGLLALPPESLVLARLIGSAAVLILVRRIVGLKLVWNLALYVLETSVAALIAATVLVGGPLGGAGDWLVVLVAALSAELIGLVSVPMVIMIVDGELRPSLFAQVGRSQLVAGMTTAFGVVCAAAMLTDPWLGAVAAAPLIGVGLLLHLFGRLGKEHHDLQQLHGFTTEIAVRHPVDVGLRQLVTILRASSAALAVRATDGTVNLVIDDGRHRRERTVRLATPTSDGNRSAEPVEVAVVSADDGDSVPTELLRAVGGSAGLVMPLREPSGDEGWILVADRLGVNDTFLPDEVRLFGSLARSLASRVSADQLLTRLELQARTDDLTGLANRIALEAELDRRIAAPGADAGFAIVLDLDRFKEVNDSLGHRVGDALLGRIAERLEAQLRREDLVARLGGDEFAAVVEVESEDELPTLLNRLVERLSAPIRLEGITLEIGASIGVARWPHDAVDGAELLRLADIAMYEAKRTQEPWLLYDTEIDHASPERLALLGEVRCALENRDIRIHLQPQFRPGDGRLVGAEALIRWHHPERGVIPPGAYLPLAEQSSVAPSITRHVIAEAVAASQQIKAMGSDLVVWVNLMARDLLDESLPGTIRRLLVDADLEPGRVGFEVTESSLIVNLDLAIANLGALRVIGCPTSVDDFGTGYSSLQYLQRLPVDEVKIDQSFIKELATDTESAAIVRLSTQLVHDLGKRVVAEGVEDEATLDFLTTIDCDVAQGYHLGRPMPVDDFLRLVDDHQREEAALPPATPPVQPTPSTGTTP